MSVLATFSNQKNAKKRFLYECKICDFNTCNKTDYERHNETDKHKMNNNQPLSTILSCKKRKKTQKNALLYSCEKCNKSYKDKSGLWRHNKKCTSQINNISEINNSILETTDEGSLVKMLLDQNKEFKDLLVEQHNQMMSQNTTIIELSKNNQTINNTNNINSHNKTFNLQFFLNETCKDAMNLSDFVKNLQLNFTELEKMGEVGFAEGLSRMFVRGLSELDITKRPIHCTDVKRDIMHIKNEGKWERESADQKQIKKAIKQIENRNVMHLYDWKDAHPGCGDWDSKLNTKFLKMQYEAMGSGGEEQELKDYKKIIHKVSENTIIDKEKYKNL